MKRFAVIFFIYFSLVACLRGQENSDITVVRKNLAHNYNGKTFENTVPTDLIREGAMLSTLWRFCTKGHRHPEHAFHFTPDSLTKLPDADGLKVMWLGHASVLIEIDGKRFLTDPVFSNRTSPYDKSHILNFLWSKRFFPAPLNVAGLPNLDGVLISHDHSDHLDYQTIIELGKTGVRFFVPLKVGDILASWGISRQQITEINWWDSISIGKTHALVATPARHDSGRKPFFGKRDRTLWCSWVIAGPKHRVFFGGDTGYSPDFKKIGDVYGPFDIDFLPIGAYDRNWPYIHMTPEEAVEAHDDLKGKVLFPIHWGTFNVAIHPWDEPVKRFMNAGQTQHINYCLPSPGKLVVWPNTEIHSRWWEAED
ncbi:MAG TPA: MBL fold metallo-hydrolase [Bacteroidales bacterium]